MQEASTKLHQVLAEAVRPVLAVNVACGSSKRRSDAEKSVAFVVVKLARMLRRSQFAAANVPWVDETPYVIVGKRVDDDSGGCATMDAAIYWQKDTVCLSGVHWNWSGQRIWIQRSQQGNKRGWVADLDLDAPVREHRWRDFVAWAHPTTIAAVDAMAESLFHWMQRHKRRQTT